VYRLLTEMSVDRLAVVYEALPEEMTLALSGPIGQALNSRPQSVAKRPVGMKVRGLRAFLLKKKDETLSAEMLRAYFLGPRADLVKQFLDATGVAHEDGQVEHEDSQPDPKKVATAVKALREKHDDEDVDLYLRVAAIQWPENEGLAKAVEDVTASA